MVQTFGRDHCGDMSAKGLDATGQSGQFSSVQFKGANKVILEKGSDATFATFIPS